jgi:hypothetical protein
MLSDLTVFLTFWTQHIIWKINKGRKVYPFSECFECSCEAAVCDFALFTIGLYFIYKSISYGTAKERRLHPARYKMIFALTQVSAYFAWKSAGYFNLGYNTASLCRWLPTFRRNIMSSSSRVSLKGHLQGFQGYLSTPEDEGTVFFRNVWKRWHGDAALYPTWKEPWRV